MSDNAELISILDGLGGRDNIKDFFHCATRLRFNLYDYSSVNTELLKSQPSVLSVVLASGQCQIIIGNKVESVYHSIKEIVDELDSRSDAASVRKPTDKDRVTGKENILNIVFGFISGCFLPVIGILSAAGLLRALSTVLQEFHYFKGSETLEVMGWIGNVPFYYMPVILGFTIAKKLKSNEVIGIAIGASLLYPEFTSMIGNVIHFAGLPIIAVDYGSTVFPVFFAVISASFLEKLLKKVIPSAIALIMIPAITLMIVVPLTLLLLGPFGTYLGTYLAEAILYVINLSGLLSGILIGALYSFIVMFGLHWALIPVVFTNFSHGGDPIYAIGGMSAIAQMGVALGIFLKTRDKKTRQLAGATCFPALFSGVTEPILYGLIIPHKRTIPIMLFSGAVGGGIIGYNHVKINELVFSSFLAIPTAQNMMIYTIALFSTLLTAALLVMIFGYQSRDEIKEQ